MDDNAMGKIQGWFENLSTKFETGFKMLDDKIEDVKTVMVTKQQFENRFNALLTAMLNLNQRFEVHKTKTEDDAVLYKRALRDLDRKLHELKAAQTPFSF